MKHVITFLFFLAINSLGAFIAFCQPTNLQIVCNDSILLDTHNHIGKLSKMQMTKFLLTFDKSCENNVEFSEWSNELLFNCLQNQPALLISVLASNKNMKMDIILEEISSPVNDGIKVDSIAVVIKRVKGDLKMKKAILKELAVAADNQ